MDFLKDRILLPFTKVCGINKKPKQDNAKKNSKTKPKIDISGRRCNYFAIVWFWITVIGVFYCGFGYIVPRIYDNDEYWIHVHLACASFIFIELFINWLFMKFVTSPFKAAEHETYLRANENAIINGGFEIDVNDVKRGGTDGRDFSIPRNSLFSSVNDPSKLKGTLFVVDATRAKESLSGFVSKEPKTLDSVNVMESDHNDAEKGVDTRKLVFPYWSWKPCMICQTPRPPRTHHCPICGTCVLKRDHHCFFTGSCVGLRNQRYFVAFTFWGSVATIYTTILSFTYLAVVHVPNNTWWDAVWPITVIRCLLGYVTFLDVIFLTIFYSVAWFCLTAVAFFREQMICIMSGITSFEQDNGIKIASANDRYDNLSGVFGKNWYLNFLLPLHFIFPQSDDGIAWSSVKAY